MASLTLGLCGVHIARRVCTRRFVRTLQSRRRARSSIASRQDVRGLHDVRHDARLLSSLRRTHRRSVDAQSRRAVSLCSRLVLAYRWRRSSLPSLQCAPVVIQTTIHFLKNGFVNTTGAARDPTGRRISISSINTDGAMMLTGMPNAMSPPVMPNVGLRR